jgi:hypothetical protein
MAIAALLGLGLAACGGGDSETTSGGPPLDVSHANLQQSDLPPGWKLGAQPQDTLAKHIFACLGQLESHLPENDVGATGPDQLKAISDVIGWATLEGAQTATFAVAGGPDAESCVGSSIHFVVPAFGSVDSGSVSKLQPPAGAGKETVAYGVRSQGPNGAARGAVVVTTRGRATAAILAYRSGKQPFPPEVLSGLAASVHQRLGEAKPGGP